MKNALVGAVVALGLFCLSACGGDEPVKENGPKAAASVPETYWLASAPTGEKAVAEVRKGASAAGSDVVVVGRVSLINEKRAFFRLVDKKMVPCNERPGDTCKTPWDYCCEPDLKGNTVNVELRDDKGLVAGSLKGFHGMDLLKEVVVKGKASKDENDNVTVVATGLHVR